MKTNETKNEMTEIKNWKKKLNENIYNMKQFAFSHMKQ